MKTYKDSYLYNVKINNNTADNPGNLTTKEILAFTLEAHRIDKESDAFRGVIEDIKRQQISSVLMSVMMSKVVVLCINNKPLPRAFTVFDAYDSKNNKEPRIFIDLTGKVEIKDGYYVARKNEIDKICSLLFDGLVHILYRYYPTKLSNSINLLTPAVACYVKMFTYILDYLRVIGYSENKKKISYIVALYFLHSVYEFPLNDSCGDMAAKAAQITPREAQAYNLYIESEEMFENIGTFLPALIDTFRLKGIDLPTFISRWMKSFGPGTEYATELLAPFLSLVVNAYSGSYIVQQRQIEVACGSADMTKVATSILKIGSDCIGNAYIGEATSGMNYITKSFAESMKIKNNINDKDMVVKTFNNKEAAISEAKNIINTCKKAMLEDKINVYGTQSINACIECAYNNCINSISNVDDNIYEFGTLHEVAKLFNKSLDNKQKYVIENTINRDIDQLYGANRKYVFDTNVAETISKTIIELREALQYI